MSMQNDQQVAEITNAVRQALLDLHIYGTKHPVDDAPGKDVQGLIAAGALSPSSAAFIATHQVHFLGFKPKPIRPDIPVLDVELAERTPPLHFIGFRDGHVEVSGEPAAYPQ
jgi:hypothetical protein